MRQAENKVKIEGILAETDLKYGSFVKNGETVENVGGSIKVLVEQEVNGEHQELMIPVYMFSTKYTKQGKLNPAYESIEKVMKEFVSIAAAGGKEHADRIRITSGNLRMNEFPSQNGQIVSQVRVNASFVSKVIGAFNPEATFSLEFVVSGMSRAVDSDGNELDPAKLEVNVVVPQYTAAGAAPNVDVMKLVAVAPNVINAVENYWENNATYKANGRLNFSSTTKEFTVPVDFGEPKREVRTINISELVITGGSQSPLDEEFGFDLDEIKAGLAARKTRLADMKNGKANGTKQAPAQKTDKGQLDLGF